MLFLAPLLLAPLTSAAVLTPPPASSLSVLITPDAPDASLAPCLLGSYFGSYGSTLDTKEHVYVVSSECMDARTTRLSAFEAGSIVAVPEAFGSEGYASGRLVWVGAAGVSEEMGSMRTHDQVPLSSPHVPIPALLHLTASSMLIHVPTDLLPILDTLLPPHYVPVALPLRPLRPTGATHSVEGLDYDVPEKYAKHLANITKHLSFVPSIDRIVSTVSLDEVRRNVRWLTGEAPSGIVSRHSFTEGAIKAAHWIKNKVEATGADCHLHPFLTGFAPNVICTYPSLQNSTDRIILSGHYDSRGSFGSTRAPGGDDDGSGSAHVLAISEAIKANQVEFEKSVTLAFFAGEEQGLFGSHYYAEYLDSINATVILQIQADMLGYHAPGEPMQLGLPATIELPEAGWLVANLSKLYSPELVVGRTAACCSDHQSFVSYGFPATQVFERNGPIVDPMYHNSGDLSNRENYDFEQIVAIAKVTFASLLTVAGFRAPHPKLV